MTVVSDASVCMYLAKAGVLHVLPLLYGRIVVPPSVWDELTKGKPEEPEVSLLLETTWIEIQPASLVDPFLPKSLHAGEAEAISLACEILADVLLMDEKDGRRAARARGLEVRGTVGILLAARLAGHVDLVMPILATIQGLGFRIGDDLMEFARIEAGE